MMFIAHALLGVYMFCLCISAGFWYLGTELANAGIVSAANPIIDRSLDLQALNNTLSGDVQDFQDDQNAWDVTLIFGNFFSGATNFMKIISGGYLMDLLVKFGFPESMQLIVQVVIIGFGAFAALIYYVSGRQ